MLRLVEKGSKGWRQKRERKLRELAPRFCVHGYKPVMERLVNRVRLFSSCHEYDCMQAPILLELRSYRLERSLIEEAWQRLRRRPVKQLCNSQNREGRRR